MSEQSAPIAIVPARGGSKRIAKKNVQMLGDKPLIVHVIDMVKDSGIFGTVLVSTDDPHIADVAQTAGADVHQRPEALADDDTPLLPVVQDAMSVQPDSPLVCLVLATAALLRPDRLSQAHDILNSNTKLDFVIGVRRFETAPQRGLVRDQMGRIRALNPDLINARSQDLEPIYHDAGQFSFGRRAAWEASKHSFLSQTGSIELSRTEAIDIDEPEDLAYLRMVYAGRDQA